MLQKPSDAAASPAKRPALSAPTPSTPHPQPKKSHPAACHDHVLISSTPQAPAKRPPAQTKPDINCNSLPPNKTPRGKQRKGRGTRARRRPNEPEEPEEAQDDSCKEPPHSPARTTLLGTLFSPVFQFFGNQHGQSCVQPCCHLSRSVGFIRCLVSV